MNSHCVTWLDTGESFLAQDGEFLLDAALRQGIALPHDCRLGGCGACRLHLEQGELHYDEPPFALEDQARESGQALACVGRVHASVTFSAVGAPSPAARPPQRTRATVVGRDEPAPSVTRLRLALPEPSECGGWLPGQHLDVILPDGNRRSFSMANAPGGCEVELHIRHIEGGEFTSGTLPRVRPGDTLELELPLGRFHWRPEDDLPVLMVATGTGIAPLKAILEAMEADGGAPPAALYWGQRERGDFYLANEIRSWTRNLFEFRYTPVLSRPDREWNGRCGHVQQAVLDDGLDLANHVIYLCGSAAMVRDATAAFVARGARPERLYRDSFLFQRDRSIQRQFTDEPAKA